MMLLQMTLLKTIFALAGIAFTALPALAAGRYEVVDGMLIDHSTGLVWQALSATAGTSLPPSPLQGSYRVASGAELFAVLPHTGGSTILLSTASDL